MNLITSGHAAALWTGLHLFLLLILSLLAGRDKQSALPTDLLGKLSRRVQEIRRAGQKEAANG